MDAPVEQMPVADLTWHLDFPIWTTVSGRPLFDLRPRSVLDDPDAYPGQVDRIRGVDLSYPVDLMWNVDRFAILDGVHRLARLVLEHQTTCYVRRISRSAIPFISGITDTLPPAPGILDIHRFEDSDLSAVKELHVWTKRAPISVRSRGTMTWTTFALLILTVEVNFWLPSETVLSSEWVRSGAAQMSRLK